MPVKPRGEEADHWEAFSSGISSDALWNPSVYEPIADGWRKPDLRTDRFDGVAVSQAVMPPMVIKALGGSDTNLFYQIVRVSEESTFQMEGLEPVKLAPDELLLISSNMRGVWTTMRSYTTCSMHVEEALFREYFEDPDVIMGRRLHIPFELSEVLRQMMDAAMAMSGTRRFQSDGRRLTASFMQILSLMPKSGIQEPSDRRNALDLRREQIKSYLRRNFASSDLSIETVARHFSVSPRYIQMAFAAEGGSPSEYLRRCRIEAASRMLTASDHTAHSITQIAYDCGFGSSAHFSNEFRRHFGSSPRDYRKSH